MDLAAWSLTRRLERLSDSRLVLLIAFVLFALAAWPLLLVELPPLQDLPNHVASVHILTHPDIYPEYASNGFFKSNSLLTLWLYAVGGHDLFWAARVFAAVVLAMNALALPLFVLRFAGRERLLVAMLFVWPLVHPYFFAMGMLNFVLGVALSLMLLTVLDLQRERATVWRGLGVAGLAMLLWFAHPFPLVVVLALVGLHIVRRATWRERFASARALLLPLLPVAVLTGLSVERHLVKADHAPSFAAATFAYHNPWEILIHFWRDVSGALTGWGSMTLVPAVLLPVYAWRQRRASRFFFSTSAMVALAVLYVALPQMLSNWWHLNCRLVSFLWAGLALRLPATLPRSLAAALVACALAFSVVTGVDYVRLDRDRAAFTAGMDAVPERATLLPLIFKHSRPSEFTASLSHAWAYYTVKKNTSAPLVFAVERSYPITYREFPPLALIPPALDRFAERNATPARVCKSLGRFPVDATCVVVWRELWEAFWRRAQPRFSHVLTWAMPAEARSVIPLGYRRVFVAGALDIYARIDTSPVPSNADRR